MQAAPSPPRAASRDRPRRSSTPTRAGRPQNTLAEPAAVRRRAAAEGPALHGLPGDAREAEGHRRGRRRHARTTCTRRSRRRRWTSASTSTCRSRCAGRCRKRGTWRRRRRQPKVVTQMGNQGHSTDGARLGYEYITGGAIGDVREVHVWTNRPLGYWPQGIPRPAPLPPQDRSGRSAGTDRASRRGSPRRSPATTRCRMGSRGICSSASRRRSTTTRSITRSTGAAGWTGARARSATWART